MIKLYSKINCSLAPDVHLQKREDKSGTQYRKHSSINQDNYNSNQYHWNDQILTLHIIKLINFYLCKSSKPQRTLLNFLQHCVYSLTCWFNSSFIKQKSCKIYGTSGLLERGRAVEIPCRTCPTWSHFIQDKLKISIYLSLDKYKWFKLIQFCISYFD